MDKEIKLTAEDKLVAVRVHQRNADGENYYEVIINDTNNCIISGTQLRAYLAARARLEGQSQEHLEKRYL